MNTTATSDAAASRWRAARHLALTAYGIAVVWSCVTVGLPVADDRLFAFVIVGLLCASIGRPAREIRNLFVDWTPFATVILGYDYSRGWAHHVGFGVHFQPQITVDKLLFAGHVPTEWLQQRLYTVMDGPPPIPAGPAQWWEALFQVVYISHFVAWIALAAGAWIVSRSWFHWYVRRLVALAYLGFITYVVFPAAPPWLAAQHGYLASTVGRFGRGLDSIGLSIVGDLVTDGAKTANPVAAVPSLHFGFAVLVAVTLSTAASLRLRPWIVAYPAAMALVLVATGEHYVVDLIVGGVYVALACTLAGRAEGWWRRHRRGPLAPRTALVGFETIGSERS